MYKIGIIGGGNMGEAILARTRKHYSVCVSEKDLTRQKYLEKTYHVASFDIPLLVKSSSVIIVAVKPQDMGGALKEIGSVVTRSQPVISIAAGITTQFIEKILGKNIRVVRTMPNMPALIGEGMTAICGGRFAKKSDIDLTGSIFNNLGKTVIVSEESMDAITAVSGSGPAYVYLFMECIIKAAKSLGLKEKLAADLIKQTFLGSINLLLKRNEDPAILRAKVTSKGGTTAAALDVFMHKGIDKIINEALKAAKKRARALSKK